MTLDLDKKEITLTVDIDKRGLPDDFFKTRGSHPAFTREAQIQYEVGNELYGITGPWAKKNGYYKKELQSLFGNEAAQKSDEELSQHEKYLSRWQGRSRCTSGS